MVRKVLPDTRILLNKPSQQDNRFMIMIHHGDIGWEIPGESSGTNRWLEAAATMLGSPADAASPPNLSMDLYDELGLGQETFEDTFKSTGEYHNDGVITTHQPTEMLPNCQPHSGDVVKADSLAYPAGMSFPGYPALDSGPLDLTLDAYNDSRFNQATVKETCSEEGFTRYPLTEVPPNYLPNLGNVVEAGPLAYATSNPLDLTKDTRNDLELNKEAPMRYEAVSPYQQPEDLQGSLPHPGDNSELGTLDYTTSPLDLTMAPNDDFDSFDPNMFQEFISGGGYSPYQYTGEQPSCSPHPGEASDEASNEAASLDNASIPDNPAMDADDELGLDQEAVEETYSDEVFSQYQHTAVLTGCRPHPGDVVEAGSLAALPLPPVTYPLQDSLPERIVAECKLSSLQLSGIVHACQRHQLLLPSGQRAGFFLGDAAGVGKGRQIAGLIIDNFARGRTKHIWFSNSSDLMDDARRDLKDIGCDLKIIKCQELDKKTRGNGLKADFAEGIIFSTYRTLVSSVSRGKSCERSRMQQLVQWCGGANFEGCLVFDECHKAKNFVPGNESSSTKVAVAVARIQRLLPKARVVYCSATGVTDVQNMAFMERLGLWGEGAPFKNFQTFLKTVEEKGLGMAEMLAMEMKSTGMYVSRGLSFKQAEFTTVEIDLTKEQIEAFDKAAHVWNKLREDLKIAVRRTKCTNKRIWSSFWSSHQRFFKQLCLGLKVPAILSTAQEALDNGYCVVLGLQTTGEASLEYQNVTGGSNGSISGFVSVCREILSRFIQQHFPTKIEMQDQPGLDEQNDDLSAKDKEELLRLAAEISLPNNPLDDIIDKLGGPDAVAEMTGRHARIVRHRPDEQPHYETRNKSQNQDVDSLNIHERNNFMTGKKLVAIISDAASTGISLHADLRVPNQRRRMHITIELPWSADKAVQQLGRSHRSNQSSGPIYKLMTTNLGGERRFTAAVARRLQSLGALTKGDRRAATGADLKEFNFDTPYGQAGLKAMYSSICQRVILHGVTFSKLAAEKFESVDDLNEELLECLEQMELTKQKGRKKGDVSRFLNRILGLSVARQQLMFRYFCEALDLQIRQAEKEGRYNEGLVDIIAASVQLGKEPVEVFKDLKKTPSPIMHTTLVVDRGMSWEKAKQRLENLPGPDNGFYKSKRATWGKSLYILATLKQGSSHLFKIARPNTGVSNFEKDRFELESKYSKVTPEEAESEWVEQYMHTEAHCIHGPRCKTGPTCSVGSRCYRVHLLCGAIMTLMSELEDTIERYRRGMHLTKAERSLRVVRAQLDSGERLIGIRYPESLISLVGKKAGEEPVQEIDLTTDQITPDALDTIKITSVEEPVAPIVHHCLQKAFPFLPYEGDQNDACQIVGQTFLAASPKKEFSPGVASGVLVDCSPVNQTEWSDISEMSDCDEHEELKTVKNTGVSLSNLEHSNDDSMTLKTTFMPKDDENHYGEENKLIIDISSCDESDEEPCDIKLVPARKRLLSTTSDDENPKKRHKQGSIISHGMQNGLNYHIDVSVAS